VLLTGDGDISIPSELPEGVAHALLTSPMVACWLTQNMNPDMNLDMNMDIVLVVATGDETSICQRRKDNIHAQAKEHSLRLLELPRFTKVDVIEAKKIGRSINDLLRDVLLRALHLAATCGAKLAIVAEDDVHFCPNFRRELLTSVASLPSDWRTFHLCPGCYWGRSKGEAAHNFRLNPENPIHPDDEASRWSDRVFQCPRHGNPWGGPIAFAIQPCFAQELINKMISLPTDNSDDEFMRRIADHRDFVSRDPQLCYENQQGGSTLK